MYEFSIISIWCGVIAGPLFIVVFLMEGLLRPDYWPLRQPVSALAMGPRGWIQRANFYITGVLALMYALHLNIALSSYSGSFWAPLLVGIFGVGLIGAGLFVTDLTGLHTENLASRQRTRSGVLHDIFSLPVFAALFAACLVFARIFSDAGESAWSLYSVTSAILLCIFFILAGAGFSGRSKLAHFGGLMQRISIIVGWSWLSAVAAHVLMLV